MATIVVPNPNPAATQFETSITNTSPDWKTPAEKGELLSILGPTIHHVQCPRNLQNLNKIVNDIYHQPLLCALF